MKAQRQHPQGIGRVALVGIIAGVAICLFAGIFTWMVAEPSFTISDELDVALRQMIKGDTPTAVAIAEKVGAEKLTEDDIAKRELIFGVEAWERCERAFEQKLVIQRAQEAEDHLSKAKELGFPKGYEGLGNYALGMTIAKLRNAVDAIEPLKESTKKWPIGRSKALETIIEILLTQNPPKLDETHEELDRWSALPDLDDDDIQQTLLAKAKLLAKELQWNEAYEVAKEINPASTPYIGSRLLMCDVILAQADTLSQDERTTRLEEAYRILGELDKSPDINISDHRVTLYLKGVVLRKLGRIPEAERAFFSVRQGFPETPEAMASAVAEIELIVQQNRPEDAAKVVTYVNNHYGKPEWYVSPRFRIEDHRGRLVAAGRELIRGKHYEEAQLYGSELPIVCNDSDRFRVQAESFRAQGLDILEQAQGKIGMEAAKITEQAQAPLERAGQLYEKLSSRELVQPEYFELLWTAIDSYQKARNWNDALKLLERYIELEERSKRPRALLAQSDIFLATKRDKEAIQVLRKLLGTYENHPLIYRGRMLLSHALKESQEFDEATELLLKNLNDGNLTPESLLWHDSLYQLGDLHFHRGFLLQQDVKSMIYRNAGFAEKISKLVECDEQLKESIRRFEFAIQKFPNDAQNLQAQYKVAQAYRMRAQLPHTHLTEDRLLADEKRRQFVLQRKDMYEGAIKWYTALRNDINARQDALQLDDYTSSIFRNCYFGIADLRYELQDYKTALQSYQLILTRYSNEPESLEAMVQMVRCYEKMNDKDLIRLTINKAIQTLNRIPADRDDQFQKVTSRDRAGWNTYLNWMLKNA